MFSKVYQFQSQGDSDLKLTERTTCSLHSRGAVLETMKNCDLLSDGYTSYFS